MTFQWPYALVGLVFLPVLVLFYLAAQQRRRAYALRFANLALLAEVAPRSPGFRRHVPPLLYLASLAALLLAVARPTAVLATPREDTAVMLVVDTSGSMAAADLSPTRMGAAQKAAHAFVDGLPGDASVGLVSFAGSASVRLPLSRDRAALDKAIDGLRTNGGTAIGDGLTAALDQLAQRPVGADGQPVPATVVLLSDGESNAGIAPGQAAQRAASEGIAVETVGIGERGQTAMVGRNRVGLDEQTLQAMAEATGGQYFYAAESGQLSGIYRDLSSRIGWVTEETEVTALFAGAGAALVALAGLLGLRWFQQFP